MSIYFAFGQIPELAGFSEVQRRTIYRGAMGLLHKERPSARWLFALPAGIGASLGWGIGVLIVQTLPEYSPWRLVIALGVMMVGSIIGACVSVVISYSRLRPYYLRFIEDHKDELSQAA